MTGIRGASVNILNVESVKDNAFKTMPDEKDNKLFYGIELEVLMKETGNIKLVQDYWNSKYIETKEFYDAHKIGKETEEAFDGHCILKPDAAFEIVTLPATLRYHKEVMWSKFFKDVAHKCRGDHGVGMHIHFSTAATHEEQLTKIIRFFMNTKNSKFLTNIAGRVVNGQSPWNMQAQLVPEDKTVEEINKKVVKGCAIHVSKRNDRASAECRIWQSNPTEQGVFQGLEFLDMVIWYFNKHGTLEKDTYYTEVLQWFYTLKLAEVYPYLAKNLDTLGYANDYKNVPTDKTKVA